MFKIDLFITVNTTGQAVILLYTGMYLVAIEGGNSTAYRHVHYIIMHVSFSYLRE